MSTSKRHIEVFGALLGIMLAGAAIAASNGTAQKRKSAKAQEVRVTVTETGFEPASLQVKKGVPIVLVMTRKTERTCATRAVFAALDKSVELPLNKAVRIALPAQADGRLAYACGMGMIRGELVVQ